VHYNLGSISIDALLDSRPIHNVTAVQYRWAAGHSTTGRQCTILTGSRFLDARRHEENCGRQGRVCQNRLGPHLFCQINFIKTWIAFFSSSYYFRNWQKITNDKYILQNSHTQITLADCIA
jgi:hypothetical protein